MSLGGRLSTLPVWKAAISSSRAASVAPPSFSFIQYAEEHKKRGLQKATDPKAYKVQEYLNFNKYSYYDTEVKISPSRVPQPSNKRPDVAPKTNAQ